MFKLTIIDFFGLLTLFLVILEYKILKFVFQFIKDRNAPKILKRCDFLNLSLKIFKITLLILKFYFHDLFKCLL